MATRDRRVKRMRGSRMHGWGNTQKHRGAGSRGGHGMAGSKKHKWHYISKYFPDYFGGKGFKRHSADKEDVTMNVGYLGRHLADLVAEGAAKKSGDAYEIDLGKAGYTKLLGAGSVEVKLKIRVAGCSASAKAKVEAKGGSVESGGEGEPEELGD